VKVITVNGLGGWAEEEQGEIMSAVLNFMDEVEHISPYTAAVVAIE
jgi:hypothetical protein